MGTAVQAALRPVPRDQDALRVWAIRLYKLFCRRGPLGSEQALPLNGETEKLALDAARLLYAARPFAPEQGPLPDVQESWHICVKTDMV